MSKRKEYQCCCDRYMDTQAELIACHKKHDRENPECIIDKIGTCGDPLLDRLVKRCLEETRNLRAAESEIRKIRDAYAVTETDRANFSMQLGIIATTIELGRSRRTK